jgi:prepilin-type N-terminal cleavage/methylation domain-containing protein
MKHSPRCFRRAFTLVELLIALVVMVVITTAVGLLLQGSARSYGAMNSMVSAQWEIELALRRIVTQTRFCTSLTTPNTTTAGTTLDITSQADPDNGNATYAISYSLITAADGTKQLQESDPRYGNSILVHDVVSLDIHLLNPTDPKVVVITIVAGKSPNVVTRTLQVTPRNL